MTARYDNVATCSNACGGWEEEEGGEEGKGGGGGGGQEDEEDVDQGPISLTIFPSQFKCDGNFILLSSK